MIASMATDRLDFVIYGATGFTGHFVVKEVAHKAQDDKKLTWGVAGRDKNKLMKGLLKAEQETGNDFSKVKVFEASTDDYNSLLNMASQARVVLNCVGPYRFHGEPVVRACVEAGTHHVDISGEPEYLEKMELLFSQKARETGSIVVGACGMDSIPNDLGIVHCQEVFDGEMCGVESYLAIDGEKGVQLNTGTWNTLIHSIGNWKELSKMRKTMPKVNLPKPSYKVPQKNIANPFNKDYYAIFAGADKSVVYRTQRDEFIQYKKQPISTAFYFKIGPLSTLIGYLIFMVVFGLMTLTKWGRDMLIKYPEFFSFGRVRQGGPTMEIINQQFMKFTFRCYGYSKSSGGQHKKPDIMMTAEVTGPDPGYISTSRMLVESAWTLLREKDRVPTSGGVLTPGFAFKNTSILKRLADRDIKFRILDQRSI